MSKNLYIHIGIAKTGTTSFQRFMLANRASLAEKGILYPLTGTHLFPHAHSDFFFSVRNQSYRDYQPPNLGVLQEQLNNEIQKSNTRDIVLSAENFANLSTPHMHDLKDTFKDFNVKVVVYLRHQAEFIWALFYHKVRFRKFIGTPYDLFEQNNFILFYDKFLRQWSEIFGEENLVVSIFDNNVKKMGISQHLFSRLGFAFSDSYIITSDSESNRTPSSEGIQGFLLSNIAESKTKITDTPKIISKTDFLRDKKTLEYMDNFKLSNEWVGEKYFSGNVPFQ